MIKKIEKEQQQENSLIKIKQEMSKKTPVQKLLEKFSLNQDIPLKKKNRKMKGSKQKKNELEIDSSDEEI